MRLLLHRGDLQLLVPDVVIDEFERNRDRVETTMTTTVAQRFKFMKQDLGDYGGRAMNKRWVSSKASPTRSPLSVP